MNLGYMYEFGQGVATDMAMAARLYALAADAGNADASMRLGLLSMYGRAGSRDLAKAVVQLETAARGGAIFSYNLLADIYSWDDGIPADPVKVRAYLQAGADQGSSRSQSRLGAMYHFGGNGLPQDYVKAASLYQQAVDSDDLLALNNLGDLYENGHGVPQDYARALELYRRAAREGYAISLISLADLYEKGLGVQQDPVLAYTYCKLSLQAGRKEVAQRCDSLSESIRQEQVKAADAYALAWKKNSALPASGDL